MDIGVDPREGHFQAVAAAPGRARDRAPRRSRVRIRPPRASRQVIGGARRGIRAVPAWMYRGYNQAGAGDLAAAIAFNALVALVPTALLLVFLAGLLFRDDRVLQTAILATLWALPGESARDALAGVLHAKRNTGLFGILSVVGFAWIGVNFVASLGRGMNRIYGVPNRRYVHERLRGFVVIVLFSFLLAFAAIAAVLPTLFIRGDVRLYFERWFVASGWGQIISYGVAVLVSALLFLTIYRAVPNARQRFLDIWPGALVATVLFLLLVQAFPLYLRFFVRRNLYGDALLLVSLFVTWFYLMAHVLLFGTFVNATWQHRRRCHGQDRALIALRLPSGLTRWVRRDKAVAAGLPVAADPCDVPAPGMTPDAGGT
ncbi:MAG: hypothetical protein AVDCRST_MAG70-2055 [uncultured Thermomicrobiales bacterium]|uniref:YihY/virulence factor BrkB family protein n=1 Tax=uncultured Thermomicrobiales bacterium TaxID=1645740 RepID=A0A6J4V6Y7_9BACT|nr:MAG: hypothetical protein AVDCRST_MAG70-2055 [uncultured Thermomicrobiales bacterium]